MTRHMKTPLPERRLANQAFELAFRLDEISAADPAAHDALQGIRYTAYDLRDLLAKFAEIAEKHVKENGKR